MENTSKVKVNERSAGAIIEIDMPNGELFRITVDDKKNQITVQSVEGGIIIKPSVSNEVRITTSYKT